jgi:hypothetical protein
MVNILPRFKMIGRRPRDVLFCQVESAVHTDFLFWKFQISLTMIMTGGECQNKREESSETRIPSRNEGRLLRQ